MKSYRFNVYGRDFHAGVVVSRRVDGFDEREWLDAMNLCPGCDVLFETVSLKLGNVVICPNCRCQWEVVGRNLYVRAER